jgi:short-subunit dehydrogenase
MRTILVTGATSGIGLLIARHLQDKGFTVYGTSRTPEKHRHEVSFELLEMDLASDRSIQQCVGILKTKTEKLDALINNAGTGVCGSAEETTLDQAFRQFETNFWGTVKMTRNVLPMMRQQRYGKIITIGSLAGLIGVPFQGYYSASKHALEGFYKSLRLEVAPFNIKVSIVEPGFFKTNLSNVFEYAEPSVSDYDITRNKALEVLSSSVDHAGTPEPVARMVRKILDTENPRFSYPVGKNTTLAPMLQFLCPRLLEFGLSSTFRIRRSARS